MFKMFNKALPVLILLSGLNVLQAEESSTPISAAQQKEVIDALSQRLKVNYVFADVAQRVAKALDKKWKSGAYAKLNSSESFVEVLDKDLRELGNDGHFGVGFDPEFKDAPNSTAAMPESELIEMRKHTLELGYGIQKVERLQGNIAYLELRGFGPTFLVSEALTAAIMLLQGTDAMIIDLRRNGGGDPATVAHFMSHFFPEGEERHLNDLYSRKDNTTRHFWTNPAVSVRYNKPVYVLTSARTFSGGEECAYDFQTQKRATLIGEITGGGANAGDILTLAHGFIAFIPSSQAINPITKTNWEHVGVKPDIAVPAAQALQTAHAAALKTVLASSNDVEQQAMLKDMIKDVENNTLPPPNYKPRQ